MARTPSTGDDGSTEARLARLEESAASGDWLSGRVASIDSHLERATEQLDAQGKKLEAIAGDISAMRADVAAARKEGKERDEKEAERFGKLAKDSEQWVSTLPPGWRRTVGLVVAVLVVAFQAYAALKMDLR